MQGTAIHEGYRERVSLHFIDPIEPCFHHTVRAVSRTGPVPLLEVLSWIPPLPQRKNLVKEWQKSAAVISLSSVFPRKKARTSVLTFEKLASIRAPPSLRMFFLRTDLPLPHRNALTYPRKHRKGAHRRRHRSSCFRQQRTHTPLPSRKQRVSHPSSSLS